MSSPGPITCCCNKDLFVCCLTIKVEAGCPVLGDLGNCQVGGGPLGAISFDVHQVRCVESEEQCNCDNIYVNNCEWFGCLPGGFGSPAYTVAIVECEAVFLEGELCVDGAAPPDTACERLPTPCPKYKCGPCGPIPDGCSTECPQTIPTCTPQACCQPPPPPPLCCFYSIAGDCISDVTCAPCPENPTAGIYARPVENCDECNIIGTPCILLTTGSCGSSEAGNVPGDCCPGQPDCCVSGCGDCSIASYPGYPEYPTPTCGKDCGTYDADGFPTCSSSRCYCSCDSTPPNTQLPLCNCDPGPILSCGGGPLGAPPSNPLNIFAEGRLTSGFISVDSVYSLNTLFLFGYGNKHL